MRKFLEENIGNMAELTLTHAGQKAQIAGTIKDVRDDIVLLSTEDGLLAGDMNNLLYAKMLSPKKIQQNTGANLVPPETENANVSTKFAPILYRTDSRTQTIL